MFRATRPGLKLSIVIPLHNGLELTRAMLASLWATVPAAVSYEIILVDNASADGTPEWLSTLAAPRHRILRNATNHGYARANNQGAAIASGEILGLLNNDLVLLPGWLEPMLRALDNDPKAIVGNVQLSVRSRQIDHAGIFFDPAGTPGHFRPPLEFICGTVPIPVPAVTGACVVLATRTFLSVGGFDEGFVNGYEDIDLCLRAEAKGHRTVVAPDSVVYHYIGATAGRHLADQRNAARFQTRWLGSLAAQPSTPPAVGQIPSPAAAKRLDRIVSYAALQAYHPDRAGLREELSSIHLYPMNRWTRVTVRLDRCLVQGAFALRVDPVNFPAEIQILALRLREVDSRRVLWTARGAALSAILHVEGTVSATSTDSRGVLAFRSTGDDPQVRIEGRALDPGLVSRQDLVAEFWLRTVPSAGSVTGRPAPRSAAPVRVAVDLTRLSHGGQNGGVKPFVFGLLQAVSDRWPDAFTFTYFTRSSLVDEVETLRRNRHQQVCVGQSEGWPMPVAKPGLSVAEADLGDWQNDWPADVLYAPLGFSPLCRRGLPWISFIVDTLHRDRPDLLPHEEVAFRERWFREVLASADAVQCNSEFVRRQVIRHFGASNEKLFVTPNAIHERLVRAAASEPTRSKTARTYFFYPANDWPHKNHEALLRAYALYRVSAGTEAWDLVLGGYFANEGAVRARTASLGIVASCRTLGYLGTGSFAATFRDAGALVFPSLYEGFGIPVLEAMALGVPVACSNAASLPEIAGDAALYFDPSDPHAIATAMLRLAGDPGLRETLARAGIRRAARYSLAAVADTLADRFVSVSGRRIERPGS